jgi:D-alanine-D-alanine ligase
MKVLVLAGGSSNEREVSLKSGTNIARALREAGHEVTVADPANVDFDLERLARQADVIFPALHGAGGEDGSLQRALEALGVPFVGSRSAASELAFDKVRYKQKLLDEGILTPRWEVVNRADFAASALRQRPYVLKPIQGGSSIHAYIVHEPAPSLDGYDEAFDQYGEMLLEELIHGQELTVGVLDSQAFPVILIEPPAGELFDYANKYNGKTREVVNPTEIPVEQQRAAQQLAVQIHDLLELAHLSRTDIILSETGDLYVLESNTIPGLTDESLFPKAALAHGLDTAELAHALVEVAYKHNNLRSD